MKAARSLAGVEQIELADASKVHVNTIRAMEASGANGISVRAQNVQAVQRALEGRGIEFPQPFRINRRFYFKLGELDMWDERQG
ncbi:hypothetical protein AB9F45_36105, partial [Rhizobium leguminosarum]|uniref:hypothetical protein n=1 Tax=Rhizobium leguminosarum TaxID=384 RepID=UPI003F96708D